MQKLNFKKYVGSPARDLGVAYISVGKAGAYVSAGLYDAMEVDQRWTDLWVVFCTDKDNSAIQAQFSDKKLPGSYKVNYGYTGAQLQGEIPKGHYVLQGKASKVGGTMVFIKK